jgi:hypothetical protein
MDYTVARRMGPSENVTSHKFTPMPKVRLHVSILDRLRFNPGVNATPEYANSKRRLTQKHKMRVSAKFSPFFGVNYSTARGILTIKKRL